MSVLRDVYEIISSFPNLSCARLTFFHFVFSSCKEVWEKSESKANAWFFMKWLSFGQTGGSVVLSVSPYGTNCFAISADGVWAGKGMYSIQ